MLRFALILYALVGSLQAEEPRFDSFETVEILANPLSLPAGGEAQLPFKEWRYIQKIFLVLQSGQGPKIGRAHV